MASSHDAVRRRIEEFVFSAKIDVNANKAIAKEISMLPKDAIQALVTFILEKLHQLIRELRKGAKAVEPYISNALRLLIAVLSAVPPKSLSERYPDITRYTIYLEKHGVCKGLASRLAELVQSLDSSVSAKKRKKRRAAERAARPALQTTRNIVLDAFPRFVTTWLEVPQRHPPSTAAPTAFEVYPLSAFLPCLAAARAERRPSFAGADEAARDGTDVPSDTQRFFSAAVGTLVPAHAGYFPAGAAVDPLTCEEVAGEIRKRRAAAPPAARQEPGEPVRLVRLRRCDVPEEVTRAAVELLTAPETDGRAVSDCFSLFLSLLFPNATPFRALLCMLLQSPTERVRLRAVELLFAALPFTSAAFVGSNAAHYLSMLCAHTVWTAGELMRSCERSAAVWDAVFSLLLLLRADDDAPPETVLVPFERLSPQLLLVLLAHCSLPECTAALLTRALLQTLYRRPSGLDGHPALDTAELGRIGSSAFIRTGLRFRSQAVRTALIFPVLDSVVSASIAAPPGSPKFMRRRLGALRLLLWCGFGAHWPELLMVGPAAAAAAISFIGETIKRTTVPYSKRKVPFCTPPARPPSQFSEIIRGFCEKLRKAARPCLAVNTFLQHITEAGPSLADPDLRRLAGLLLSDPLFTTPSPNRFNSALAFLALQQHFTAQQPGGHAAVAVERACASAFEDAAFSLNHETTFLWNSFLFSPADSVALAGFPPAMLDRARAAPGGLLFIGLRLAALCLVPVACFPPRRHGTQIPVMSPFGWRTRRGLAWGEFLVGRSLLSARTLQRHYRAALFLIRHLAAHGVEGEEREGLFAALCVTAASRAQRLSPEARAAFYSAEFFRGFLHDASPVVASLAAGFLMRDFLDNGTKMRLRSIGDLSTLKRFQRCLALFPT
eukprot:gnl/Chilomastix_cuspidata/5895.p1 GENE.gnl/Chilomastix_cuspidata/5895~~gnl/Chilomastix_cuspidata/5895.p1  ORF type:complete len:893 (+),score=359.75 gnl/Chilomastix_cuspidata/5895:66-2744(+)